MLRFAAIAVLIPFGVLTGVAIVEDGSGGFPAAITYNLTATQIWLDLVIAMLFWCAWVWRDAGGGVAAVLWIVAALAIGAFAPLLYLVIHQRWPATPGAEGSAGASTAARGLAAVGFLGLLIVTVMALRADGTDIAATVLHSWSNIQIWVDLVIVIVLWLAWMVGDAARNGRAALGWVFVLLAFAIGSFSPLLYTMIYGRTPASHPRSNT